MREDPFFRWVSGVGFFFGHCLKKLVWKVLVVVKLGKWEKKSIFHYLLSEIVTEVQKWGVCFLSSCITEKSGILEGCSLCKNKRIAIPIAWPGVLHPHKELNKEVTLGQSLSSGMSCRNLQNTFEHQSPEPASAEPWSCFSLPFQKMFHQSQALEVPRCPSRGERGRGCEGREAARQGDPEQPQE